jgi:hypothetical protein
MKKKMVVDGAYTIYGSDHELWQRSGSMPTSYTRLQCLIQCVLYDGNNATLETNDGSNNDFTAPNRAPHNVFNSHELTYALIP